MGRLSSGSRLVGPLSVVVALAAGVLLPVVLSATGGAASLTAAHAPVASCSPPSDSAAPAASVPPPCTPTLAVVPSAELADGQVVTVTGTNFTPNVLVGMAECEAVAGSNSPSDCDLSTASSVESDGAGDFSISYSVTRILNVNGANVDCAVTACLLGAADVSDYSVSASAALGFNPTIPPELTGTVSPTDQVNTKTGTAFIRGTVSCVAPAAIEIYVDLSQIYHRRFNFENENYGFVTCAGRKRATAWKVSVPPGIGLFGVGKATVEAQFSGTVNNSFRSYTTTTKVVLSATNKK
jgi:hypothetical protein